LLDEDSEEGALFYFVFGSFALVLYLVALEQ
jgi:hypothetical protein